MTAPWLELAERLVAAHERIASALERGQGQTSRRAKAGEPRRRGLRATTSETVVPTELDRARAAKALRRLGYLKHDDKT